ncbi:hypothetical protein PHJA_001216600 [Phtheirospermum japonicum]|uniref:Uncharacterized protein n=1 Tax=Phtheirospermum japonicum TaxID=374723 RepID=A0A830BS85_9LAMI|nr:hypothetical protein PHJA_001216600 [Phtheirospermum japonicum]
MAAKINSSFSSCSLPSSFHTRTKLRLSSRIGQFDRQHLNTKSPSDIKVDKSCQLMHGNLTAENILPKRKCILYAASEDQESFSELEPDDFEQQNEGPLAENSASGNISNDHLERAPGKPGLISFYGPTQKREDEILVSSPAKSRNSLLWLVGPTVLVASFVFPSLYLRRIISSIFEDSLLTDRLNRPKEPIYKAMSRNIVPQLGHRVSSVAVLVLSIIIPTVTMGFVWPWTGPAASATLAPYLVGIVVQFAFEQYAKYIGSPSWPAIPIVFQVYRLHQLNRAAQLVTALSFTVRGAEMTPHNVAINGSLSTLLNVLQFLGVISIWSLSSFVIEGSEKISENEWIKGWKGSVYYSKGQRRVGMLIKRSEKRWRKGQVVGEGRKRLE